MNVDVLTLIRALLTGGEASELERVLTEGSGLVQNMVNQPAEGQSMVNQPADVQHSRCRSSLSLLSLQDSLLQHIDVSCTDGACC